MSFHLTILSTGSFLFVGFSLHTEGFQLFISYLCKYSVKVAFEMDYLHVKCLSNRLYNRHESVLKHTYQSHIRYSFTCQLSRFSYSQCDTSLSKSVSAYLLINARANKRIQPCSYDGSKRFLYGDIISCFLYTLYEIRANITAFII